MTILGNIAERLKTDIGENLRASIDVDYSKQLTEDRFNARRQEKKDKKEAEIRLEDRKNALADEARKQKYAMQTKLLFEVHASDKEKGNYTNTLNFSNGENVLPQVAQAGHILATNSSGKSLEAMKWDAQQKNENRKLDQADLRNKIANDQLDLNERKFAFDELKERNEAINTEMDRIREKDSVFAYVNWINTSPALTEKQRAKWIPAVSGPINLETAKHIFDSIQKENLEEMKGLASIAAAGAKGEKPALPGSPTKADRELVRSFLPDIQARIPEFDKLSKEDKENVITFIAGEMKSIGKHTRENPNLSVLKAIETAKAGFISKAQELGWAAEFSNSLFGGLSDYLKINPTIISSFSAATAAESKGSDASRFVVEPVDD